MVITASSYLVSSPDYQHCPQPDRPEYAFIGRSNVGKSSLINMLCNYQKLANTSAAPGKTQMINHFAVEGAIPNKGPERFFIVDLPGYGFAKVSQQQRKNWEKMTRDYLQKRENLVNVFVLVDGRIGPQKLDIDFINQLGEWQVPFCLVFTKADKTNQQTVSKNVKDFLQLLRKTWEFLPPHFVTSAVKKTGRDKILAAIAQWNEAYKNRDADI